MKGPRCAGTLKDGSPCEHVAVTADGYCQPCARKLTNGGGPSEREREDALASVLSDSEPPVEDAGEEPVAEEPAASGVEPGRFRERARADISRDYEKVRASLSEAMSAEREVYVSCPHCRKRSPVPVPDAQARVAAIRLWSELGFGKPAAEQRVAEPITFVKRTIFGCENCDCEACRLQKPGWADETKDVVWPVPADTNTKGAS